MRLLSLKAIVASAILEKRDNKKSLLEDAIDDPEKLHAILTSLPEKERLITLLRKGNDSKFKLAILVILSESDRLRAITEKDSNGQNLLCHTTYHSRGSHKPETQKVLLAFLKDILALLPKDDQLPVVVEEDNDDFNALHYTICDPTQLTAILTSLPAEDRLKAVLKRNRYGISPLRHAASNCGDVPTILALLPEKDCKTAKDHIAKGYRSPAGIFYRGIRLEPNTDNTNGNVAPSQPLTLGSFS